MSWFDEQIKQRIEHDDQVFADSFACIANAVTNEKKIIINDTELAKDAIKIVLKNLGYNTKAEIPSGIKDINEQLEYLCRPFGVMHRRVRLTQGWYKDCIGPMLAFTKEDNTPIALLPDFSGYKYIENGVSKKVNEKTMDILDDDAICFYKPFPTRKITPIDLIKYAFETRSIKDYVIFFSFTAISSLLGLLLPKISYFLYSDVVESKSVTLLISTITFLICVNVSTLLFDTFKALYNNIISTKMTIAVQAATMMRILSLPANFFRKYSSGELSSRAGYLTSLCNTLMSLIFSTGISSLFSLVYIFSIFEYAPGLVVPALIIIVVTIGFSVITTLVQNKITKELMENSTKESGLTYAMLTGIRKIRLAGAEKRIFAKWANLYSKNVAYTYNPPFFIAYNGIFSSIISLSGTIVMYFFAIKTGVNLAEYSAFNTAYGMVFGAFSSLASIALSSSQIKPVLEMATPIMDGEPEVSDNKEIIEKLNGNIEFNNVCFRYDEKMPLIVNDLTLKIKANQYIAIVGKTGCGKSTLIRLLLGFEKAQKGAIYYDGKDINSIDLKSLRRKIGVVMQDGKLFQGDIFSNITISAPWLTLDEAWAAAEMAGIADDIRDMPMGMNTLITEGSGGISGGQRQRLLIARAVAPKPKILIFDEATSALDNITQKQVSEALDSLKCTRIVIAHRLSTIKHCDRILYLEDGKIKEDGTYEELIAKNGLFAELVNRQRLDINK